MHTPPQQNQKNSDYFYTTWSIPGVGRIRRSCKTNNKRDANEYSLKLYNKLAEQAKNPNAKLELTVNEIAAKYWKLDGCEKAAKEAILIRLRHYNNFFGKYTKWHHINDSRISDYVSKRRADYVPIIKKYKDGRKVITYTNRHISAATINKELATLGRINKLATENWNVEPATFIIHKHKLDEITIEKPPFIDGQDKAIQEELPEHWQKAFKFLMLTGARVGNVTVRRGVDKAVKRKDINLEDRIIKLTVKHRKKEGKVIDIPIIDELYDFLIKELDIESLALDDYLFTYPDEHRLAGKPLGEYRKTLYRAMESAGFNRKRGEGMHLTRHTVVTRIVSQGGDLAIAQELAGHADIKTTRKYAHRSKEQLKLAMEKALGKK